MEHDRPAPPPITCGKPPESSPGETGTGFQNQEPRMSDIPQERRVVTAIPGP